MVAPLFFSRGSSYEELDTGWSKCHDLYNNRPTYRSFDLYLFYDRCWNITKNKNVIACALNTFGTHPITIYKGEWTILTKSGWKSCDLYFYLKLMGSIDNPYDLEDIGEDHFIRLKPTKPIWFTNPDTNEPVHSGAKYNQGMLGKRYCWICKQCFSANNWASQHVKNVHDFPLDDECQTCMDVVNTIVSAELNGLLN